RLPGLRDPEPAIRACPAGQAGEHRTAPGAPVGERASRASLPADQPPGAGDRVGAVCLAEYDQDTPETRVREARCAYPRGRGQPGPRARPAIALLAIAEVKVPKPHQPCEADSHREGAA